MKQLFLCLCLAIIVISTGCVKVGEINDTAEGKETFLSDGIKVSSKEIATIESVKSEEINSKMEIFPSTSVNESEELHVLADNELKESNILSEDVLKHLLAQQVEEQKDLVLFYTMSPYLDANFIRHEAEGIINRNTKDTTPIIEDCVLEVYDSQSLLTFTLANYSEDEVYQYKLSGEDGTVIAQGTAEFLFDYVSVTLDVEVSFQPYLLSVVDVNNYCGTKEVYPDVHYATDEYRDTAADILVDGLYQVATEEDLNLYAIRCRSFADNGLTLERPTFTQILAMLNDDSISNIDVIKAVANLYVGVKNVNVKSSIESVQYSYLVDDYIRNAITKGELPNYYLFINGNWAIDAEQLFIDGVGEIKGLVSSYPIDEMNGIDISKLNMDFSLISFEITDDKAVGVFQNTDNTVTLKAEISIYGGDAIVTWRS